MVLFVILFSANIIPNIFAEKLDLYTNSFVYTDKQPLFVYGNALSNEHLIIRLFAPDGTIIKFDQILTDSSGSFNHVLLIWPESSTTFPYGTYALEVISTEQNGFSSLIELKFTSTSELIEVPVEREVNTLVFAPDTAAIGSPFRVFVQVTSDGLLIPGDPTDLLGTSHIHSPSDQVESLSTQFSTLHQGLYFVDFTPRLKGTYVFHIVTFNQGTISHGSAATLVLSQDIGGISDQIIKLNEVLDQTSEELETLKEDVARFDTTLEGASTNIDSSVTAISLSVTNIEEASGQLNALLFPIVGLVAFIVALQIVILARRR